MPRIGADMHLLRRPRPAPEPTLLLRSFCHELRPSIAALSSLVKALEDRPADDLRAELTRLTLEHTAHATAVLEDAAAAAAGRSGPWLPPVPLEFVLPVAAATVPAQRLIVRTTPAARLCPVHPAHTRQILINLLSNAARHSPQGRPIHLRAWTTRRRIHLLVADHGRLTPALIWALHRRRPPRTDRGIGLWTVRALVSSHSGSLRVRPMSPTGIAIEVTLPRTPRTPMYTSGGLDHH